MLSVFAACCLAVAAGVSQARGAELVGAGDRGVRPQAPAAVHHEVPDTLQQRMLACTGCHGNNGRATPEGYVPRIAGKPAAYLYKQLLNFREGRRNNAIMTGLLEHLSNDYLQQIAEHFAALDLPYARQADPPAVAADILARGERLVRAGDKVRDLPACTACHGAAMTGQLPAVPGLLGLPRDYLVSQLGAWQTSLRAAQAPDCMALIARKLSASEVSAVASWLALQPVPADAGAAPAPAIAGPVGHCAGLSR